MADHILRPIVYGSPYDVVSARQSKRASVVRATNIQEPVAGGTYGERIAAALTRAGRTKQWLAKEIGVQWQTVHSWTVNQHQPDGANIAKAAEALHMSPGELLGILDGQEPPFEAWRAFLETADGKGVSPDERRALAGIPWPRGKQPTVASYQETCRRRTHKPLQRWPWRGLISLYYRRASRPDESMLPSVASRRLSAPSTAMCFKKPGG